MRRTIAVSGSQRGTALIVSLVMLVALMLLGISGLQGVNLQSRMGSALYDRQIAFQAAESGMRSAESAVSNPLANVFDGTNGLYPKPDPAAAGFKNRWEDGNTGWESATAVAFGSKRLTPQYIVEDMGSAPDWFGCNREFPKNPMCETPRYRITSRSSAPSGEASVVLQAIFKP